MDTGRNDKRARIKVVYYSDAPYCGGAEYYLTLLAVGLPRERFDVRAIVRPLPTLDGLRGPLQEAGIPVFEPREPSLPDPGHWMSVYMYLRRVNPDVFHVNLPGPYDGRLGSIPVLGKMAGVHVVTTEHLPMVRGGRKDRLLKRISQRFVDRVITVSGDNVRCLEEIHGVQASRIRRIYNGVDVSVYSPGGDTGEARERLGLRNGEKAIGIIGRLNWQKRHDLFLEAAQRVHARDPRTRFFVIGDGHLRADLERMAQNLGLTSVVHFLGQRKDVPSVLRALDLIVFASLQEGMPFALLEALAMEKAVVATRVLGLQEVVRDRVTGRLVASGDSHAIAEALVDLLMSPEDARTLGIRGRELVKAEFGLEGMIRQTAEVYESLVN